MKPISPPRWALRFFRWFCDPDYVEDIEGDLIERFGKRSSDKKAAKWLFALDVLRLFRPGIIKSFEGSKSLNYYGMFKNYYKVGVRNILRNKTFSFLNVTGLSVGIASCILIMIYVKNELSYDAFNSKYDNTYRVLHYFGTEIFPVEERFPLSEHQVWGNAPVGVSLKDFYPEVDHVFQFTSANSWLVEYEDLQFQENDIVYADSGAFHVFDWKMYHGDPKNCLTEPNTVVLSTGLSRKIFGDENPVGKMLTMDSDYPMKVTGVYEIPPNAHLSFDAMVSMPTFQDSRPDAFDTWGYVDFYTYFTLNENADITVMSERIPEFISFSEVKGYTVSFEALADAYLNSEAGRQPGPVGNKNNIYLFISVALCILVIACINFMNLSTARAVERAKEVAIRKTIGSLRGALIAQFLVESFLLTTCAGLLAFGLVILGHPYLETLVGKALPMMWLTSLENVTLAVVALLVLSVITGSYPAFVLSNFKPIKVLKGSFRNSSEGIWLRKSLVVLQFSLSIVALVGTAVVYNQLSYLKSFDKGFDSEQILVIDYGWDSRVQQNINFIKSEFAKHNAVASVSASRATPGEFFPNAGTRIEAPNGEMIAKDPALFEIDNDFIETYDINVIAGRGFKRSFPKDSSSSLIINEACARYYGYNNAADAVGKKFSQWGREGQIIGVVKDFNYVSLHSDIEPLALRYSTGQTTSRLSLKLKSGDYSRTLAELEDIWIRVAPYRPFVTYFNNANFNDQYEADERFGTVFSVFSGLAIFVACLGLFGLTIYSASQRAKEIGVRKVLGASTQRIVALLSYDFIKLFALSLVVSIPISLFVMNHWLEDFAYRITVGWEVFALATAATLLVSLVTMSFKTVSVARTNPAEILKDE
ncbi:MAG: ABC transporter permease [Cyclobacteriaceae bacterium]